MFVTKGVYQGRLEVCRSCEFVRMGTGFERCVKCGCFMRLKAKLSMVECPVKKWGKV